MTPPRDRVTHTSTSMRRVCATWNRLLDTGARVRGLVTDRAVLGTPTNAAESMLATRSNPQRVPAATLRRLFFFSDVNKDTVRGTIDDRVATLKDNKDLSDRAVFLLDRSNPFVREHNLRTLGCVDADDAVRCIDLCFTTFERSAYHFFAKDGRLFRTMVAPLIARCVAPQDASKVLDYYQGVPVPKAATCHDDTSMEKYAEQLLAAHLALWAIATWRIVTSMLLERALCLHPLDNGMETPASAEDASISYSMHLYRDTHLDLLTHMVETSQFSDEYIVDAALRSQQYPHALRVLCTEELPRMADIMLQANLWYDLGIRKTPCSRPLPMSWRASAPTTSA